MKLWKLLVILFCVLISGVSHAGFLSNEPGLSPGQTLPPGLIIPGPIISNPQLTGLITTVPGSTLWIQGNVQYAPWSIIAGPDGSIWNANGITNLASLTMSGVLTFADGSYWDSGRLDTTTHPVLNIAGTTNFLANTTVNYSNTSTINGPDGSVWNNTGLSNLKSLSVVNNLHVEHRDDRAVSNGSGDLRGAIPDAGESHLHRDTDRANAQSHRHRAFLRRHGDVRELRGDHVCLRHHVYRNLELQHASRYWRRRFDLAHRSRPVPDPAIQRK